MRDRIAENGLTAQHWARRLIEAKGDANTPSGVEAYAEIEAFKDSSSQSKHIEDMWSLASEAHGMLSKFCREWANHSALDSKARRGDPLKPDATVMKSGVEANVEIKAPRTRLLASEAHDMLSLHLRRQPMIRIFPCIQIFGHKTKLFKMDASRVDERGNWIVVSLNLDRMCQTECMAVHKPAKCSEFCIHGEKSLYILDPGCTRGSGPQVKTKSVNDIKKEGRKFNLDGVGSLVWNPRADCRTSYCTTYLHSTPYFSAYLSSTIFFTAHRPTTYCAINQTLTCTSNNISRYSSPPITTAIAGYKLGGSFKKLKGKASATAKKSTTPVRHRKDSYRLVSVGIFKRHVEPSIRGSVVLLVYTSAIFYSAKKLPRDLKRASQPASGSKGRRPAKPGLTWLKSGSEVGYGNMFPAKDSPPESSIPCVQIFEYIEALTFERKVAPDYLLRDRQDFLVIPKTLSLLRELKNTIAHHARQRRGVI
ncbi:MAG: hypothetical protein J3Q66DRAFT_401820 [Benniella sp.]|nr:MAG: hypothetical protein J3Q66DRAFT_401820 [Benniella sp.]